MENIRNTRSLIPEWWKDLKKNHHNTYKNSISYERGKEMWKEKKSRKVLKEAEILFVHRNNLQILINALLWFYTSVLRKEQLVTFQNLELFICFVRKWNNSKKNIFKILDTQNLTRKERNFVPFGIFIQNIIVNV